ncbi:MAG: hypothetical protein LBC59_00255 [Chitinispirillales bacterium]|nr:hypothetical protein [Chitinispirillales bacterium]
MAIDGLDWEWKKHPVIRLDLCAGNYSNGVETLRSVLYAEMRGTAKIYRVKLDIYKYVRRLSQ